LQFENNTVAGLDKPTYAQLKQPPSRSATSIMLAQVHAPLLSMRHRLMLDAADFTSLQWLWRKLQHVACSATANGTWTLRRHKCMWVG